MGCRIFLVFVASLLFAIDCQGFGAVSGDSTNNNRKPLLGLILPLSGGKDAKARTENALEFYKGVILANEICTAQDSGIEVHLFDHKNQISTLNEISKSACLEGLDLLVGPMRASLISPLDSIAANKKIPLVNVLSTQNPAKPSPGYFSQQAGNQAIAENSFALMSPLAPGLKVGIIYGPEKSDSLLADAYRKVCLKNGKLLVLFRKVGKNSAANLSKYLADAGLDSTSHLFVPNNEAMVRLQLLSAYGVIQAKFPVIISGKWFEAPAAEYDEYAVLPFYFADPDLPVPSVDERKIWESAFIARWGSPPTWLSWKGFDLVRMLYLDWYSSGNGKFSFGSAQSKECRSSIFGKYRYEVGLPENQYVPVYKVEKTGITQVWPQ
jgi:hypothetical protein